MDALSSIHPCLGTPIPFSSLGITCFLAILSLLFYLKQIWNFLKQMQMIVING